METLTPPLFGHPPTTSSPSPSVTSPETNVPPSIHRAQGKTWAQVASRQRQSLIHTQQTPSSSAAPNGRTIVRTHVWKPARLPHFGKTGSMFFDVTACSTTQQKIMELIKDQYPERLAVSPFGLGSRRLVEVSFKIDNPQYQAALTSGVMVPSANIQVLPSIAMDNSSDESNILRLSLSRLPLLSEDELLPGLQESLQPFGQIINVGIFREPKTQTYMGTGYAIINRHQRSGEPAYRQLTHNLSWQKTDYGFHAVWTDMPPWCRCCHQEGHVVAICPNSRRRKACYNCSELGHLAAMCPRGNYGKRLRKMAGESNEFNAPSTPQAPVDVVVDSPLATEAVVAPPMAPTPASIELEAAAPSHDVATDQGTAIEISDDDDEDFTEIEDALALATADVSTTINSTNDQAGSSIKGTDITIPSGSTSHRTEQGRSWADLDDNEDEDADMGTDESSRINHGSPTININGSQVHVRSLHDPTPISNTRLPVQAPRLPTRVQPSRAAKGGGNRQ